MRHETLVKQKILFFIVMVVLAYGGFVWWAIEHKFNELEKEFRAEAIDKLRERAVYVEFVINQRYQEALLDGKRPQDILISILRTLSDRDVLGSSVCHIALVDRRGELLYNPSLVCPSLGKNEEGNFFTDHLETISHRTRAGGGLIEVDGYFVEIRPNTKIGATVVIAQRDNRFAAIEGFKNRALLLHGLGVVIVISSLAFMPRRREESLTIHHDAKVENESQENKQIHEQLHALLEKIGHVGWFEYDMQKGVIFCSTGLGRLLGWEGERDLSLEEWIEAFHRDDRARLVEAFEQASRSRHAVEVNARWIDEKTHWLKIAIERSRLHPHCPHCQLFGAVYDESEQYIAAHESNFFKNQVQTILDMQPQIVVVSDGKQLLFGNKKFLEFVGHDTIESFRQHHTCICDLFLVGDGYIVNSVGKNWLEQLEENAACGIESKVLMWSIKDQEERSFLVFAAPFGADGLTIVSFVDITASEKGRQQLMGLVAQSEWELIESYNAWDEQRIMLELAESIGKTGIWQSDLRSNTNHCSSGFMALMGLGERKEISAEDIFAACGSEMARVREAFGQALDGREETIQIKIAGKHLSMTMRPVLDDQGQPYRIITVVKDVTQIYELIHQSQMQERMMIQQSKMAIMGEMIGAIAHQWRQPLNAIALTIQDIGDAYSYGELTKEYLDGRIGDVMKKIDYMSQTIDDFRNFFRPDKKIHPFGVKSATEDAIRLVAKQFASHGIEINVSGDEVMVNGYPNEYKQVVLNLLTNARDAICDKLEESSDKRRIEVVVKSIEGAAIMTVRDYAGGIPEEIITKIFEPYFTTKPENKGTGIGLYMSRMIIEENMGGKLEVHNEADGACFTVTLPQSDRNRI
ncbi:MAG: PAS domain-containing protein [Campylobacterales bacterium]